MIMLQLPAFPKGWYFGWILDRKELRAQPRIRLAWQTMVELFFFGCSRGDEIGGRSLPFFQNCVAFVSY